MKIFSKKAVSFILSMLMLFSSIGTVGVLAERSYKANFSILGKTVELKSAAYSKFDTVFVPLKEVLGYINLSYTEENGNYTINRMNTTAELKSGNMVVSSNGKNVVLPASPKEENGVLYVPVEFFSVALDIPVTVASDKRSANIFPNIYKVNIDARTAAAVSAVKPTEDVLATSATGADILRDQMDTFPEKSSYVYYKANLDFFKGKTITAANLYMVVTRNESGPSITAVRTAVWEKGNITWNNQPALCAEKTAAFAATPTGAVNASLNIKTLVDAAMTEGSSLSMKILGTHRAGAKNQLDRHAYTVKGVNTTSAPYIKITVEENYSFPVKISAVSTDDEGDSYYSDMGILRSLGVFTQNDEFPLDLNEGVQRQEFVRYALRLRNATVQNGTGEQFFSDVAPNSPYYSEIMAAYEMGYISGRQGIEFRPYDRITVGEAITILGRMLGYNVYADERGGFTPGYFAAARLGDLYVGAEIEKEILSFKKMFNLLEDSLDAAILEVASYSSNGSATYTFNENKNILTEFWNAKLLKDIVVTANEYSTLVPGQSGNEGYIKLGTKKLRLRYETYNDFLGYKVKAWCNNEDELLYIGSVSHDVKNYDICTIREVNDSVPGEISFTYKRDNGKTATETFRTTGNVIYNGRTIAANAVKKELIEKDGGNIKIVGDDLVVITAYDAVIVTSVDTENERIYDLYDPYKKTLYLKDCDYYSFEDARGAKLPLASIKVDDVISVAKSIDGKIVKGVVGGEKIAGKIEAVENEGSDDSIITIEGAEYALANRNSVWVAHIGVGASGSFYTDVFGQIVGFEGEKLTDISGYIVTVAEGGSGLKKKFQAAVMTKSSEKYEVYDFADKVEIDGKKEKIEQLSDIEDCFKEEGTFRPQGIIFSLNADGKINKVDTYYKESQKNDPDDKENPETTLNKRLVASDGRYKNGNFYNYYFLNSSSTLSVLNTAGENPTTIDDYVVLGGVLPDSASKKGDSGRVNTEIYTIGNITPKVVIAYAKGSVSSAASEDDRLVLFDRSVYAYDADGIELGKIYYYDGAVRKSVILRDDLDSTTLTEIDAINRGDIFRFGTDTSGKLSAVERVYDYENRAFATFRTDKKATDYLGAAQYMEDNRVYGGYTTHIEDGYLRISQKPDAAYEDLNNAETKYLWNSISKITKAGFYKYDANSVGIEVVTATQNDIRLSSHAPLASTGIILLDTDDNLEKNVWLLELSEMYTYSYSGEGVTDTSVKRVAKGETITLAPAPSRANHDFAGWDINGTSYQPGEAYAVSADVTIKATWVYNPTINFYFADPENNNELMHTESWSINKSDGSGEYSEHTLPTYESLVASGYVKEGYTLTKWKKEGVEYAPGETYIPGNDGYTTDSPQGGTFEAEWTELWGGGVASKAPSQANDGYYEIDTAEDLAWFANAVKTTPNLNARLISDIYMNYFEDASGNMDNSWYTTDTNVTNAKNWSNFIIGTSSVPYTGTFDGNGKTVYNLYLNGKKVGLFGVANGATIKNVTVANGYVESTQTASGEFASLLCCNAKNSTTIQGCLTSGKMVPASSASKLQAAGSIVGLLEGSTITGCSSAVVIVSIGGNASGNTNSANGFGGIAGRAATGASSISDCSFTGTLDGAAAYKPGGILGRASVNTTITRCVCGDYDIYGVKAGSATVTVNP